MKLQEDLDQATDAQKVEAKSNDACQADIKIMDVQNKKFESEFGDLNLQIKTMQVDIKEDYQTTSDYSGATMKFLTIIGSDLDYDRYEEFGNANMS